MVTDLLNYLGEHSWDYNQHVELISLLHKGFLTHIHPPEGSNAPPGEPRGYGLLSELRQAREAMDTRFAVGADLWVDWLSDEVLLAGSSEERIAVTELFQKAIQDEPASTRVWKAYADWLSMNYKACNDIDGADQSGFSPEDKEVCRELFTRDMLLDVLEQAVEATKWRIDHSHLLWNQYIELVQEDFPASPQSADVDRLQTTFMQRLQVPHTAWDETAQLFWPVISRFHGNNWEAVMSQATEMAEPAKVQLGLRSVHEQKLQRALDSGDKEATFAQFDKYIKFERFNKKRGPFDKELRFALYERALLRFPTYTEWWLDYIDFVVSSKPSSNDPSSSVLPLIERATRHCPWSGDLWAKRILRSDVERKTHHDIEATKHRATNSGLLDVGGMEEMLKVLIEWCSYLRRHAFTATSSEDDLDTAEVGITMALEDVQQAGSKVYGEAFQGDALYRLEMIQIKFFGEARRVDDARAIWKRLVPQHKNEADFWRQYYFWELMIWGHQRFSDSHRIETTENAPHYPTAVCEEALSQRQLDWPEKVLEMYLTHFQKHESVERLQAANIEAREYSKEIAKRRAKEAAEAAENSTQQQQGVETQAAEVAATGEKRKRDEEVVTNGESAKKPKTLDLPSAETSRFSEASGSASAQIKRDREHNTVTVKDLPTTSSELDVRKFFKDCGEIISINIAINKGSDTASATVEFGSREDADYAKSRNGKELNGVAVRIQSGSQSTLYVANYPPEYDEVAIRKLFESYGEIISVRFPSLKFNSRRRFCYVQFLNVEMAKSAEAALDDKMLDGLHKLVAKISDPDAKKQRTGAVKEGRQIFIKNLPKSEAERDIKALFEQHGSVVTMNLMKRINGERLGNGFVTYATADEAQAAVAATNNKPLQDRILHVEIATEKGGTAPETKARKTDIIVKHGTSATPEPDGSNGRRGSDVSMASASHTSDIRDEEAWKTAKERKIAIFNLPDTVNDARIKAEMENYGTIKKIQLRRERNGAIVEFADIKDAFKVRGGVDCSALGADTRTGDVGELLSGKTKAQQKATNGTPSAASGLAMRPPPIARPGQRGGRRGGLGFKRGGGFGAGRSQQTEISTNADSTAGGRSNADFKAMFEKSKEGS